MSKKAVAIIGAVLLGAGAYGALRWTAGQRLRSRTPVTASRPLNGAPAAPDISLQIDRSTTPTVYEATPLFITARIGNRRAINVALENVNDAGTTSRAARPIPTVTLGDGSTSLAGFVHVVQQMTDGSVRPLPWALKVVGTPRAGPAVLDATNVVEVDYATDPAGAAIPTAGEYRLVAILEVPADARLAAGAWRGRVRSAPIVLTVIRDTPSVAAALKKHLDTADFFFWMHDASHALPNAQEAVAADSTSIAAQSRLGDIKSELGDRDGAAAAYSQALDQFYKQEPNSYEPPQYLIARLAMLGPR